MSTLTGFIRKVLDGHVNEVKKKGEKKLTCGDLLPSQIRDLKLRMFHCHEVVSIPISMNSSKVVATHSDLLDIEADGIA